MKQTSLIIGRHPLLEAIRQGRPIARVYLQKNASGEQAEEIRALAREHHIPLQMVPSEKLDSMTRANHQGVIALASAVHYLDLQEVIDQVVGSGEVPLFAMLDGITDVRNIGGIARSAVCCGCQALIIPEKGVGPLSEDALKASAGALGRIQVCRAKSLAHAADTLKLNGIRVLASDTKASNKIHALDLRGPLCLIMGNEERGVQQFLLKSADERFYLPMAGDFDSFNVSVATGIALYEVMKQRLEKSSV